MKVVLQPLEYVLIAEQVKGYLRRYCKFAASVLVLFIMGDRQLRIVVFSVFLRLFFDFRVL